MKTVSVEKVFETDIRVSWSILCDLERYPKFVPFITDISLDGPLKEGMIWHDTTNILWVTQRVAHHVKVVEEHKRLVFIVPVIGGEVREEFFLEERGRQTKVTMNVSISIRPKVVEETIGRILARRFHHMLTTALKNFEEVLPKI